jgi:hypothetical protein
MEGEYYDRTDEAACRWEMSGTGSPDCLTTSFYITSVDHLEFCTSINYHHHHISVMELGHLLTRSSLMCILK